MFNHIVVGVDGTDAGRDALALAALLRRESGTVALAHVFCPDSLAWREGSRIPEMTRRGDAVRLLEDARDGAGIEADLELKDSVDPGRGLHELAEERGADLIVIGSSRHGRLGRVMIGDDTRRTLNAAPCAVAIAPAGYGSHARQLRRIGLGYNASLESEHALGVARSLATQNQATLAACEVLFLPARRWVSLMWPEQPAIDEIIAASEERLAKIDGVEPHVVCGEPAEELARFSGEVDLLVIGSRGYGPWGRLIYGSTARALTGLARCPLLVLTRGARERQSERPVLLEETTAAVDS